MDVTQFLLVRGADTSTATSLALNLSRELICIDNGDVASGRRKRA
jgi:hypothetical protein